MLQLGIEFCARMVVYISLLTADFLVRCLTWKTSLAVCSTRLVNHYGSLHSWKLFVSEFKCAVKHICN